MHGGYKLRAPCPPAVVCAPAALWLWTSLCWSPGRDPTLPGSRIAEAVPVCQPCQAQQAAQPSSCLTAQTPGMSAGKAPSATSPTVAKHRHEPRECPSPPHVLATQEQAGPYIILKWPWCKPCINSRLEIAISPSERSLSSHPCPSHPLQGAVVCLWWAPSVVGRGREEGRCAAPCPSLDPSSSLEVPVRKAEGGGREGSYVWRLSQGVLAGDRGRGVFPPLPLPLPALSHCAPTPAQTRFWNRWLGVCEFHTDEAP